MNRRGFRHRLRARWATTLRAAVFLALVGLGAFALLGCGSGSETVTVTTGGESSDDPALQDCLRTAYRDDDRHPTGAPGQAAECLGVEEAVVAENPLLSACLAVASGLRDPRRFAQRVDKCRRSFENRRGEGLVLP